MVHSFNLLRVHLPGCCADEESDWNIPKRGILSKHTGDWGLLFSQWSYHLFDLGWLQWHFCPWEFLHFWAELSVLSLKFCKELCSKDTLLRNRGIVRIGWYSAVLLSGTTSHCCSVICMGSLIVSGLNLRCLFWPLKPPNVLGPSFLRDSHFSSYCTAIVVIGRGVRAGFPLNLKKRGLAVQRSP